MKELREPSLRSVPEHEAMLEGNERPPPGTRTAARVRWSIVALMAIAAASAWTYHLAAANGPGAVARTRYRCPMHPTIVSEQKGECLICGMSLVPFTDGGHEHGLAAPSASARGERAPARSASGGDAGREPKVDEYTCPMHPAFVTTDPKARCPQCGMKLAPRSADAPEAAAGVPGLAPVELSAERIQLIGMKTAVATREPLAASLRTVGFVTADEKRLVSVNARFTGWVQSVGEADLGRHVAKGDVLATLYSPDLIVAQKQFLGGARWSDRKGAPVGPQSADYRDARARLELFGFAPEDINELARTGNATAITIIRAPARGYVARRNVVRGSYVQPGTEMFQVADLSSVWVIADVPESEIGRVKAGGGAALEVAAYPGETFVGKIAFVYPALALGSRTLEARIELRNPGLKLRPGMFGDVTLEMGTATAVVVPPDAVVDTGEARYVFVSRGNGRFEPRRVKSGWSGAGKIAILEGLEEGERVVTTANFLLDSESRLRAALEGFAPAARGR